MVSANPTTLLGWVILLGGHLAQSAPPHRGGLDLGLDLRGGFTCPHGLPDKEPSPVPNPTVVYRGDTRAPEVIRAYHEGGVHRPGFSPRGDAGADEAYSLYDHVVGFPSRYVSTSTEFDVAASFAGVGGYVYLIQPLATFVHLPTSIGQTVMRDQNEVAAMERIPYSSVMGYIKVTPEVLRQYASFLGQGAVRQGYEPNPDFRPVSDTFSRIQARPQLAGFPPGHHGWECPVWRPYRDTPPRQSFRQVLAGLREEAAASDQEFYHVLNNMGALP